MKKIWIVLFLIIITNAMKNLVEAQNLVPNPSFEDTIQCPSLPTPNIGQTAYWTCYGGTPDLFHPCANSSQPLFGVPNNAVGSQNAFIGNAYAGLVTWYVNAGSAIREYMGVHLKQSISTMSFCKEM